MTTALLIRLGDLHARFKAACKAQGHTMTVLLRKWIKDYVEQHEKTKP
jgi:hypothetical protein